jgi:hypothetical protein
MIFTNQPPKLAAKPNAQGCQTHENQGQAGTDQGAGQAIGVGHQVADQSTNDCDHTDKRRPKGQDFAK